MNTAPSSLLYKQTEGSVNDLRIRARVVHISTRSEYLSKEQIEDALSHKTITQSAYILHDKDTYTEADIQQFEENHMDKTNLPNVGDPKPSHWHIILKMPRNAYLKDIAKWFNVPLQQIKVLNGRGAFIDGVEYLTHESRVQQDLGKHLYSDDEIISNVDFRKLIDERKDTTEKYGHNIPKHEQMMFDILFNGKTLKECEKEDRYIYMKHMDNFKKYRLEYIQRNKPPKVRLNIFISGPTGSGKGMSSRALARALYPEMDDTDIFFEVGAKGAAFEGYDGQPVIIWNDRRAFDLLLELNGRGNVFNVFDTHPTMQRQNIKYGSVNLCNTINIVNSVENDVVFLDGLAGEYTDKTGELHKTEEKGQSYRRFPVIITINEDSLSIKVNEGFAKNNSRYFDYQTFPDIIGNLQKLHVACGSNIDLAKEIELQMMCNIADICNDLLTSQKDELEEDDIRKAFAAYGSFKTKPEDQDAEDELPFTKDVFYEGGFIDISPYDELPFS